MNFFLVFVVLVVFYLFFFFRRAYRQQVTKETKNRFARGHKSDRSINFSVRNVRRHLGHSLSVVTRGANEHCFNLESKQQWLLSTCFGEPANGVNRQKKNKKMEGKRRKKSCGQTKRAASRLDSTHRHGGARRGASRHTDGTRHLNHTQRQRP